MTEDEVEAAWKARASPYDWSEAVILWPLRLVCRVLLWLLTPLTHCLRKLKLKLKKQRTQKDAPVRLWDQPGLRDDLKLAMQSTHPRSNDSDNDDDFYIYEFGETPFRFCLIIRQAT